MRDHVVRTGGYANCHQREAESAVAGRAAHGTPNRRKRHARHFAHRHEFLISDPASGLTQEWSNVQRTYWLSYKDIHGIAVKKGVATLPHQSPWKFQ
ncbi:hypothetical protein LZC95_27520 [Pendulispora brunnea]|uniref:Uncharacterized protein n=1 Tax=Pendulispora brunnea TaxID=2905690 RepID=A0ABZ2JWS3_9BACT